MQPGQTLGLRQRMARRHYRHYERLEMHRKAGQDREGQLLMFVVGPQILEADPHLKLALIPSRP